VRTGFRGATGVVFPFAALTPKHTGSPGADRKEAERPSIVHSSLYLPEPVYEVLRKIAFEERLKSYDVVLEGIDAHEPEAP
jgi:hypothetical protein